jgi:cell division protein FtsW (lipid II flippase)
VLVAGVSPDGLQARRWLPLGPVTFQPSELMKVVVVAYLAAFFHNHLGDWHIWRPMLVIGVAAGLIVAQPNVSTALFLFALAFAIMIAAGTSLQRLLAIGTAAAVVAVVVGAPYLEPARLPRRPRRGLPRHAARRGRRLRRQLPGDRARAALRGAASSGSARAPRQRARGRDRHGGGRDRPRASASSA